MATLEVVNSYKLRDYQTQVINDLYAQFKAGIKKVVLVAPTGSGKTIIATQIMQHVRIKQRRVLFIVHLDVLVSQTYEKLQHWGLGDEVGFIKADWPEYPSKPIQIASIQTMSRRNWWQWSEFDVIIFDEVHQTAFSAVGQKLLNETHSESKFVGLTATPYRLKKSESLGDHFEELVSAPPPKALQELGHLSQLRYFVLPKADLTGVKTVAGDYDPEGLKNACDRPELIQKTVAEWQRLTPDKRTIAFCVDVEHALHLSEAFRGAGIASQSVTGKTPIPERTRMYRALRSGELKVLTSVNVISIGFDEPSVEVGLLCRPTKSKAMHHQQMGRVMRIAPDKEYGVILDQSGNCIRLGIPDDISAYKLKKSGEPEENESPKKECPGCKGLLYNFVKVCPYCDHVFESTKETDLSDLIEITPKETSNTRQQKAYQKLRRDAYLLKFDPAWVTYEFKRKYGTYPDPSWRQYSIFGESPDKDNFADYYHYLQTVAARKDKSSTWLINELCDEFGGGLVSNFLVLI